jgi:flagellar biogenesis protein FliO
VGADETLHGPNPLRVVTVLCALLLPVLLVLFAAIFVVERLGGGTFAAPLAPGGIRFGRAALPPAR